MNTPAKKRKAINHSLVSIAPSKTELLLRLVLYCAVILAIVLAAIPLFIKHILIVVLCVAIAVAIHRWRVTPRQRLSYKDGRWSITNDNHRELINTCHYWSRFCVVLEFESLSRWRIKRRVIFWDACSVDDFRHIKLISRYALKGS